jgi:hypothetical protein
MALGSPGAEVTVIDESFYTPAAPGTTPLIFVATAQDKKNGSGTGTAQGTTAENAGKVWVITSQRDLTDTFGTPLFPTSGGNPMHGGEINEYGLQAAYSLLGVSSRAYVARADVDLAQLSPSSSVPTGKPVAGTYWLDTANSLFGIFEWDSSGRGSFAAKTPLVVNNDNTVTDATLVGSAYVPKDSFGKQGDYAVVATSNNTNQVFYKSTATMSAWIPVQDLFDTTNKRVTISPHTSYPTYTTATTNGSVWVKTTTPGNGANWVMKYYNGSTDSWTTVAAPMYPTTQKALSAYDLAGGGKNIPVGTLFTQYNYEGGYSSNSDPSATFKLWRRNSTGPTTVTTPASTGTVSTATSFTIRETLSGSTAWGPIKTITVSSGVLAEQIPAALSAAGFVNLSANYNATTKKLTFTHALGGDFEMYQSVAGPTSPFQILKLNEVVGVSGSNLYTAPLYSADGMAGGYLASNWKPLVYEAKGSTPSTTPADGQLWYSSVVDQVDIMVQDGGVWKGYRNVYPNTNPAGPMVSATEPKNGDRSDGGDLVDGDIWISTADLEQYGKNVYVWDNSTKKWVLQDVTDQSSPSGWLFADARWAASGSATAPATIEDLLASNYVDPDAPDPALYPVGMKLWNLRRSGFNVKRFVSGHLNLSANEGLNVRFGNDPMKNPTTGANIYSADRWVTVSPNNENGSGKFGRHAQRGYVVSKLKSMIDTNQAIRDTDTLLFNLIACPGYPEAIQNMVAFNVDIGQTAFVVGDTPFRLQPTGSALTAWGNNTALAYDNGDDGAVSYDEYMSMFYPSGYTTDNSGNNIVVPASHMMLRTIVNSDAKSYQWFAPAGTRRGGVDNATSVGYIDSEGEFRTAALPESLRDVLRDVKINPIATLPGVGIVNFGQYTRAKNASALDRMNVARLVCYLRRQLAILAKPYLFEPNDAQTRREIKAAAESLMLELVGQRALYDFIVVCDNSNNTPARIDRNELYMDIAIEPVKAVEFIYIPLRIKNTGEIAAGA